MRVPRGAGGEKQSRGLGGSGGHKGSTTGTDNVFPIHTAPPRAPYLRNRSVIATALWLDAVASFAPRASVAHARRSTGSVLEMSTLEYTFGTPSAVHSVMCGFALPEKGQAFFSHQRELGRERTRGKGQSYRRKGRGHRANGLDIGARGV